MNRDKHLKKVIANKSNKLINALEKHQYIEISDNNKGKQRNNIPL